MKIPSKVKIGAHWFDVEILHERDGYFKQGTVSSWWNKIFIQADLAQSKKESNLFHEVIHEISSQMELEFSEKEVGTLAECVYQFLVDNGFLK